MAKNSVYTFKNHLGYDGKKKNDEKALKILHEIGFNAFNDIGETPLIVASYLGRTEFVKIILEQINHVDFKVEGSITGSALLETCTRRRFDCIKLLVEAGANLEQTDRFGLTPISAIFTNTFSDPIPCAEYLYVKGAKITDRVIEMGMSWNKEIFTEFLKSINFNFDPNLIPKLEEEILEIDEVVDSSLDIEHLHNTVNRNNYLETAKIIWQKLVPKSGQADTVQGELLRAIEKLRDEAQRNGNGNFNKNCHGILIEFMRKKLVDENIFERETITEINSDLERLTKKNSPYTDDDIYERISNRIVDWYLKNPNQIAHKKNDKLYC
jgi:ankyrin repeat protein